MVRSLARCVTQGAGVVLIAACLSCVPQVFAAVEPITPNATIEQMQRAAANVRAGRTLTPKTWPGGARVAVCISVDIDNESTWRDNPLPVKLSEGEYGALEGLPRILSTLDEFHVPASFYVPVLSAALHPQMIPDIVKRGRHEIGVHGWVHEEASKIDDPEKEARLLSQAVECLTKAAGQRPRGIRAPSWDFSLNTLSLIRQAGFAYDTSMMAMDQPYELNSNGAPTGLVEIPINWITDDYEYYEPEASGSLPSPEAVYKIYQAEFDGAYQERTLFVLTMHAHVTGHRSRIVVLRRLLAYMKSKPKVWFATLGQVADYVKHQGGAP